MLNRCYAFFPGSTGYLSNSGNSTKNTTCTIETQDGSDPVSLVLESGTATFNGQDVTSAGINETFTDGTNLTYIESASTKVSVTNNGKNMVSVCCP
jgi:hypothetical protein